MRLPCWPFRSHIERRIVFFLSGNLGYAPDSESSMADSESDLETDGLDLALETLCSTHCTEESFLNSKAYCSAFCELVEEYTGQWHVPLPQLKVLRTALCSFTKATAAFPDDCQHVHYVLSSLALSFFELLLFFSKEEYGEQPLKDIFDSFLECHSQLLRHRNIYLHHVKLTLKSGGPWENPILQGILKEAVVLQKQVEEYLSSELPVLLELRVRYLQACERLQEAMALCKCCLENQEMGKHLFFHQAYLTCLYKSSLHEHLLKEVKIDGRDAVEIICNTENVEKDEVLLSLCKTFLTQQLQNGDMYYIWDLVFIWSRLYLRAHPSRHEFLSECLRLSSSATNVRAIFPFIKLVHTELGEEGIQVCVELCARALQLCNLHSDAVTRSLVCKTIAFLLPHDLEMCRACALLVFCQERSLEAYHTVCSLYKHPDDELHPHNSPVRTCIRFHILQKLKEHLCFDPEFWNLLTLRTHCLELISDKAMQAAVLNEIEEEEKYCEAQAAYNCADEPHLGEQECLKFFEHSENVNGPNENTDSQKVKPLTETENVPKRRRGRRRKDEMKKETEKARLLRTQKYSHIIHSCEFCNKTYRGLNVMRHALSHMKKKRKHCILCGQRFREFSVASKHIKEHIEEMSKQKPGGDSKTSEDSKTNETNEENHIGKPNDDSIEEKKATPESDTSQQTPTANGTEIPSLPVPLDDGLKEDENLKPSETKDSKSTSKPKPCRFKFTELKREEHESKKKEMSENGLEEGKEKEGEGQFVSKDLVYYLCPGEDCDKVFYKIGHTMTKHAMKYHLNEEKIQEVIFKWSKQKCILCHRQFNLLPHFKDHLKLHLEHPQYFCCHQSCGQRFESFQELRNHEAQHVPLRPQCMYIACENVFNNIFALGDHEWRHYIPTPLKSDLETGPNKSKRHSEEAPWKQRVKVEELWLQNKNTPREEINLRQFDRAELNDSKNNDDSETCDDETNSKTINGYYEKTDPVPKQASLKHKIPPEPDPINVKNRSEDTTIASVCEASGPEVPLIEEHRTFKPNDPAYKPLFKAPLLRPPPSMYMTESELSMRKRKMEESTAAPVVKKTLHRCEKCLSFFGSPEELNKHKSLNTCSALFGFDSDDESK
uniref:C2H2-type domain-containing protein n=1 Tax=Periophthalmus magnuspinnatus TaxID=409849 RepID=A0A3B4AMU4_9GOBI